MGRAALGDLRPGRARRPRPIGWAHGDVWPEPADPPPEKVWRLFVRGEALEGRYALQGGAFVELAEEA